jgi:nucleotide-binding universal stress UspA family protein
VLLLRPGARVAGHALVVFDGSAGSARALEAAALIAAGDEALRFSVLLVVPESADPEALKAQAMERLDALGARPAGFRVLLSASPAAMCRLVHDLGADLLILSADHPALAGEGGSQVLGEMRCPVLLVR